MSNIALTELKQFRLLYEKELTERQQEYSKKIEVAQKDYDNSLTVDYVDEYKEKFVASLASLERMYNDFVDIYSSTNGLTFSITKHIATVRPRTIPTGGVDDHFDKLVAECRGALNDLNHSMYPEDDIEPLKVFCQGLVDLRYIVDNARRLILEVGETEQRKRELIEKRLKTLEKAKENYNKFTQFETFDCASKLNAYKDRIISNSEKLSKSMLNNGKICCRNDNKFLMGFRLEDIPQDDVAWAQRVLGIPSSAYSSNPIYFDLKPKHTSLLINAPESFFSNFEFFKLIKNIYFSFASNFPAKDLLLAGIEHSSVSDSVIGALEEKINSEINERKSEDGIYKRTARKDDEIIATFNEIKELAASRSKIYLTKDKYNIFDYNEIDPTSKDFFVLLLINHYPNGLNGSRFDGVNEIRNMAQKNGDKGVITVVCQATDGAYTDAKPMLTAEELGADVIDIDFDGMNFSAKYNGVPASLDIRANGFDETQYWQDLKKYFLTSSTVWFYDMLSNFKETPAKPYYEQIAFPVGFANGKPFEFLMDVCTTQCFGLITGKSGSGKSSFLHTLILSAANRYSPDELRIRLVDFKAEADSPEFSQYLKVKGEDNLYIPHIDYLLVNGKPECALDLFDMLDRIKVERNKIMNSNGLKFTEFSKYNACEAVQKGKAPKLPFLLYIIDEYNVMVGGRQKNRSSSIKQKIISAIGDAARTLRSYGIGLIFSGQQLEDDMENAMRQMDTRIALMNNDASDYSALMNKLTKDEVSLDLGYLRGKGYSIFSVDAGKTRVKVRHAYAGYTGCEEQRAFTKKIREKYGETEQVVAGSETLFNISDDNTFNEKSSADEREFIVPIGVASASMVKTGLKFSASKDAVNYFAFADLKTLYDIERNSVFGFLNEAANNGYNNSKVYFMAENASIKDCLGDYLSEYPKLESHLEFRKSYPQIAKTLADIYDIFIDRKIKAQLDARIFDPIFVCMHDIEWLSDPSESYWVEMANKDTTGDEVVPPPSYTPASQSMSPEEKKMREDYRKMLDSNPIFSKYSEEKKQQQIDGYVKRNLNKESKPVVMEQQEQSQGIKKSNRSMLSASDYLKFLTTLYSKGNRYQIYMLISSENYAPIDEALIRNLKTTEADAAKTKYSIYGSEKEMVDLTRDEAAVKECVYVCPNVKTRLFDYSVDGNEEFWDKFINKI